MAQPRDNAIGCVFGTLVFLGVGAWLAAVLILPHYKMDYAEAKTHQEAMLEISSELTSQLSGLSEQTLVPRKDDGLDIYVTQSSFESVPYPERSEFASAIADIWCSQISSGLLPTVRFRDIRSGEALSTTWCDRLTLPSADGSYSGTVHNKTANEYADFRVQMVVSGNALKGCMQVKLPLYGTGAIHGTASDRDFNFILNATGMTIQFQGHRLGRTIRGTYVVSGVGGKQLGEFTLHQDSSRVLPPNGIDLESCPSK